MFIIIYCFFLSVPLPCIVADWSKWSAPDASGVRFRVRYMIRPALNGGKECPDLIQLGRGKYDLFHKVVYDNVMLFRN
jgi:hypothetical protein